VVGNVGRMGARVVNVWCVMKTPGKAGWYAEAPGPVTVLRLEKEVQAIPGTRDRFAMLVPSIEIGEPGFLILLVSDKLI
jgi:hypothetical protein